MKCKQRNYMFSCSDFVTEKKTPSGCPLSIDLGLKGGRGQGDGTTSCPKQV